MPLLFLLCLFALTAQSSALALIFTSLSFKFHQDPCNNIDNVFRRHTVACSRFLFKLNDKKKKFNLLSRIQLLFCFVIAVMGMLTVQVEKDPKTGTTSVKSVTPMSSTAGVSKATTVFDDGRKSIHTINADQPSTEELDQILNAVSGVGMKVLLDEVTIMPSKEKIRTENEEADSYPEKKVLSFVPHDALSNKQFDSSGRLEGKMKREKCAVRYTDNKTTLVVRDSVETEDDVGKRLEEDPVTLLFLGYTDATADPSQDDRDGMLTAQHVIITEEGEEFLLTPETSESLLSPLTQEEEKKTGNESVQGIPLGADRAEGQVQREDEKKEKQKTCRCCSVM